MLHRQVSAGKGAPMQNEEKRSQKLMERRHCKGDSSIAGMMPPAFSAACSLTSPLSCHSHIVLRAFNILTNEQASHIGESCEMHACRRYG